MGEAKRKRARQEIEKFVEMLDRWSFAPTETEEVIVREIQRLPEMVARRLPTPTLAVYGMRPNQCHANAFKFAWDITGGQAKQVTGWWHQDDRYTLHSVVMWNEKFYCVTPYLEGAEPIVPFVPDDRIVWKQEGNLRRFYRDGFAIGLGVRKYPLETLRINAVIKARLEAGIDPLTAGKPPF